MIYKCLFVDDRLNGAEGNETNEMKDMLELCTNYHKYCSFVFIKNISLAIILQLQFFNSILIAGEIRRKITRVCLVSIRLSRPVSGHNSLMGRERARVYVYVYEGYVST